MTPILIAGPTASGKSAFALDLAERVEGTVVNADSMQVYAEYHALTARPDAADEARAPHLLYGHVSVLDAYSVGDWLRETAAALAEIAAAGRTPIITGGTGLYFTALTRGLSPIPPVPPEIRTETERRLARDGAPGLAAALGEADPETAAAIDRANPRRLARAWEVLTATGVGMAEWRRRTPPPLIAPDRARRLLLHPDRAALYARCDARFDAMLARGALDEAARADALDAPDSSGAMKPVGARELAAAARGEITLEAAAEAAKTATRGYAKRQLTWFRNRMADWPRLDPLDPAAGAAMLCALVADRPSPPTADG